MKKKTYKFKKRFFNWLLTGFLIDFVDQELSFQIQLVQNGQTVLVCKMATVPHFGSKIEVLVRDFPNPDITKLFLVEDIIYSPYGAANRLIGKYLE